MRAVQRMKHFLPIALLALAGCMETNVYNPNNENDKEDNGEVTDLEIPSDFPWSTTAKVAVNITIGNNTSHTYTISVYPQGATEGSLPIAVGTASHTSSFNKEIILPASDTIIAITQTLKYTDGSQMRLECNVPIVNKKATLHLGASDDATTRALGATTRSDDFKDWEKAKELTAETTEIKKEEKYKVPVGKIVELNEKIKMGKKAKIYVAGTLIVPDKTQLNHDEAEIIVLSKKETKGEEAGLIQFQKDVTVVGDFDIENYGAMEVFGSLDLKNDAEIDNYGTMTVAGTLRINNGSEIDNHGCIYANSIELDGKGKKDDDKDDIADDLLDIEENGYVFAKTMWMHKASIDMDRNSRLEIEGTLTFKDDCEIEGDDDRKWAVVQIGNVVSDNGNNGNNGKKLTIDDKVFVVCDANGGTRPDFIKLEDGSQWGNTKAAAADGVKTLASDCASSFNPEDEGTPVEPEKEKDLTLGEYTYAFEDLWPNFGDYDMNDIVLFTEAKLHLKGDYITTATLECKLAAIGASKRIAAAVQLDDILPVNISSVAYNTGNNFTANLFKTNANGTEQEQSFAVVPLFDHAHAFAGLNGTPITGTYADSDFTPKEFTITINFKENSVKESELTLEHLNFFITSSTQPGKRMEIHQLNGKVTSLFDESTIKGDVASTSTPFRAKGNFCWAMRIPGEFSFPLEGNNIRQSFEDFEQWINNPAYDWYNHPIPGKVK